MALLVEEGRELARCKKATPQCGGPGDVIDTVLAAIRAVDPDGTADGVGIGVPGPVVPGSGVLAEAPNLPGWDHEVPVGALVGERLGGRRVVIDNDANAATLAEWRLGAGRGTDDLLGVFVGTGVGAGLVLDGRLRRGRRGLAGEIGRTLVAFTDLGEDGVGRGELEDYTGRAALQRWVEDAPDAESGFLLERRSRGRLTSRAWAEGTDAGDPLASALVDRAASALSAGIASVTALLDVERVVLGGGFAQHLGETFRTRIEQEMAERSSPHDPVPLAKAWLGDVGGALGAAMLLEDR